MTAPAVLQPSRPPSLLEFTLEELLLQICGGQRRDVDPTHHESFEEQVIAVDGEPVEVDSQHEHASRVRGAKRSAPETHIQAF